MRNIDVFIEKIEKAEKIFLADGDYYRYSKVEVNDQTLLRAKVEFKAQFFKTVNNENGYYCYGKRSLFDRVLLLSTYYPDDYSLEDIILEVFKEAIHGGYMWAVCPTIGRLVPAYRQDLKLGVSQNYTATIWDFHPSSKETSEGISWDDVEEIVNNNTI